MGAAFDWIANHRSVKLTEIDVEPLLYDKEQTRYLLGIGASKLQELMANGQLTVVYIGRSARIMAKSIHAYIAGLPTGPQPQTSERMKRVFRG